MPVDLTVVEPGQRAVIEQQFGFALKDTEPAALQFLVQRSKEAGNEAYKNRDFRGGATPSISVGPAIFLAQI